MIEITNVTNIFLQISCDYDTVLHSHLDKNHFRSIGMRTLDQFEKYHVYEYLGDTP